MKLKKLKLLNVNKESSWIDFNFQKITISYCLDPQNPYHAQYSGRYTAMTYGGLCSSNNGDFLSFLKIFQNTL